MEPGAKATLIFPINQHWQWWLLCSKLLLTQLLKLGKDFFSPLCSTEKGTVEKSVARKETASPALPWPHKNISSTHICSLPSSLVRMAKWLGRLFRSSDTKIKLTATSGEPKETGRRIKWYNCSDHFVQPCILSLSMVSQCCLQGSTKKIFNNSYTLVHCRKFSWCSTNESGFWPRTEVYTINNDLWWRPTDLI